MGIITKLEKMLSWQICGGLNQKQRSEDMKTINDIFEMLDLFYANIHLFKRLRKDKEHE